MKITTTKINMVLANKVNNKNYVVTEWDGAVAKAVTLNPDTQEAFLENEDGYDVVEVNEANSICFRTLHIPADETVPEDFTVKNGKLLVDGNPVTEQGEIVVEDIIAALPGYVVLAVKPRDKRDDLIDLFIYEPERDKFTKLIRYDSIPMPKVVKEFDGGVLLGYNKTHMEDVPDEDGVVTEKEVFDVSALMLVANRKLNSVFYERPMEFDSLKKILGDENSYLLAAHKFVEDRIVTESKSPWYEKVTVDVEYTDIRTDALWNQPNATVTSAAIVNVVDCGIVMKGTDFIQYGHIRINTPLVGQITGEYLVDITSDGDDEIFTFSDEKYNVSRLKRTITKDRGFIYSIL